MSTTQGSSSSSAAAAAASDSSPKKAELAAPVRAKPKGSSYDADELNQIRNLSLADDEAATAAGFKRGRRGSGGGGKKFDKEPPTNDHVHFLTNSLTFFVRVSVVDSSSSF